jgi:hypothetical protein
LHFYLLQTLAKIAIFKSLTNIEPLVKSKNENILWIVEIIDIFKILQIFQKIDARCIFSYNVNLLPKFSKTGAGGFCRGNVVCRERGVLMR